MPNYWGRVFMKIVILATCAVVLCGCAKSSTIPLSADTMRITTSAAPVCGATGAESIAFRRAAVETINRGYDKFIIIGGEAQNNVGVVGYTPVQAQTTGTATATDTATLLTPAVSQPRPTAADSRSSPARTTKDLS